MAMTVAAPNEACKGWLFKFSRAWLMVLILLDTVFALFPKSVVFFETEVKFVEMLERLVDTWVNKLAALFALAEARLVILVVKVEMLVVRVDVLVVSALAFVFNVVPVSESEVPASCMVVALECKLPGSTTLTPSVTNSKENFFFGSDAESIAGLKNGAVDGSSTATPVPPIAIALGSKEVNGIAQTETQLSSKENADNRANPVRMFSF
jgi:hypothetical protein